METLDCSNGWVPVLQNVCLMSSSRMLLVKSTSGYFSNMTYLFRLYHKSCIHLQLTFLMEIEPKALHYHFISNHVQYVQQLIDLL